MDRTWICDLGVASLAVLIFNLFQCGSNRLAETVPVPLKINPAYKRIEIVDHEKLQQLQREAETLYVSEDGQNVYILVPVDGVMPKRYKNYMKAYLDRQRGR